jgi:hypothetical protein
MPAPFIKLEDSRELFVADSPPTFAADSTISSLAASASPMHGESDVKPLKANPYSIVPQAGFSAVAYHSNYEANAPQSHIEATACHRNYKHGSKPAISSPIVSLS